MSLNKELKISNEFVTTDASNVQWYAIRVQPKYEKIASISLRGKGYEEFLPLYRSRRSWSDRTKELDLPLLPGYTFCRFSIEERYLSILSTPGVRGIVGSGRIPVPIDDEEIDAIRAVVKSGLRAEPAPYLHAGAKVSICQGPLAGLDGIIVSTEKPFRLIVSVSLLQRSVAVEIDSLWVTPIADPGTPRITRASI